ncbi:MAG: Ferredoxin [uncultured Cytophagales bacterium]|uniref:Ferredoxin n=1 Tax=uncultured Cytophagales bacterium TaxID=158755 RepID=A0A6J4L057_9SPHI|nr:MAG: Ferredoxin [uncultured Cytophagales bacterium]
MAILITDECTNCGACQVECPTTAIYEGGEEWCWADGTRLTGHVKLPDGSVMIAEMPRAPLAPDHFYIVPGKCTECVGFHEEPQCAAVCPVDCCVSDPNYPEAHEELLQKARWLHQSENPFGANAATRKDKTGANTDGCGCGGKPKK